MNIGQALRVGVAGHDDVRLFGQQGFKRIEEFFLRALFVGKKLDVINQQQIKRVVTLFEFIKRLALVGFDHIRHKLLGMDVEHFGAGHIGQQAVTHGMHQVGLAQTDAAIDKQRVVQVPGHTRHMHGGSACHAVGRTLHQSVEGEGVVEPGFKNGRRGFVPQARRLHRRTGVQRGGDRERFGGRFTLSKH